MHGWWALLLIALAIAGAQLFSVHRLVHRGLWTIAALLAVVAAFNEWTRSR